MSIFAKTGTTGTVRRPSISSYSAATGWQSTTGQVGPTAAMEIAADLMVQAGYRQVQIEEQYGGISVVTGTYGAAEVGGIESPEAVWEVIGNDETVDMDRSDKGKALEVLVPGILKAIEACVEKYRADISSDKVWNNGTYDKDAKWTGDKPDVIAKKVITAYGVYSALVYELGMQSKKTSVAQAAKDLFLWKVQNVNQYMFTRYALRKSVTFSGYKSSVANATIAGILQNVDRYFTSSLLISRERSTMPASISNNIAKTFTDPTSGRTVGYYIKHMPHIQVSSTGRVTASVEYAYTLDLCNFAYEAAT